MRSLFPMPIRAIKYNKSSSYPYRFELSMGYCTRAFDEDFLRNHEPVVKMAYLDADFRKEMHILSYT